MSIFDVRHQMRAQHLLQKSYSLARTPHAYIFYGPDGVGKNMLASRYARLLTCHQPESTHSAPEEYQGRLSSWWDGCSTCPSCRMWQTRSHPDLHMIQRQLIHYHADASVRKQKGLELGVDVVRQFVIEAAGRRPSLSNHKVFIIQEAELLTISAQNALLKTLEEPPSDTFLILLCTTENQLLPTVRSRCQLLPFSLLPCNYVLERLQELRPNAQPDELRFAAYHEPGSMGRALLWIDEAEYQRNQELVDTMLTLEQGGGLKLAQFLQKMGEQLAKQILQSAPDATESDAKRQAIRRVLGLAATYMRDLLHLVHSNNPVICNETRRRQLQTQSRRIDPKALEHSIAAISEGERELISNVNSRLCLENCCLQLARLLAGAPS